MSEGKGKARAAQIDEEKNVSSKALEDPSSSTLLGRIGTSANSLGRSILSPPQHGSELNNLSATALASSDKGVFNGNSSTSGSTGSSAVTAPNGLSSTKPASDTIRSRNHETRSTQVEAEFSDFLNSTSGAPFDYNLSHSRDTESHAAQAEAEFSSILDNAEPLTVPEDQLPLPLGNEEYRPSIIQRNGAGSHRTVAMQEAADGEAVSDLLSDPDFHENVSNSLLHDNLNNHSTQDEDESYWRKEEAILARLIQQDRIPEDTAGIADAIKSRPDLFKNGPWNTEDGSRILADLAHIEDKNSEIHQWYRFLTSYQEEVWGDLGPLVGEAREELKTWTPEKGDLLQQPTALRRLNLILGHFRK